MFTTQHPIAADKREKIIEILNQHLANLADLHAQTKQAHWNVKGANFISLHKLFDDVAEPLQDYVDMIAERITALGGVAFGTVRMAAGASTLPEIAADTVSEGDFLAHTIKIHAITSGLLHEAITETTDTIDDPATADLFTEILRTIDKHLYFLEAHVQG